ncbi:MAG: hypothetical protein DPW18_07480 [Chloroflexi bacterium]|nr:hypothetical protein [Chloroflexota bacterium]MDL1941506.1 glycosyltransferase family 4 protein [Chloroflexi bacterium CFX2]
MGDKLRIVLVEQRGMGGMIHYSYQMCTALANEGADVTLVTAREYELQNFPHNFKVESIMDLWSLKTDPLLVQLPRNAVEALGRKIFWNVRRAFRAMQYVWQWVRLTNHLLKRKPDVIQFGASKFAIEAVFYSILKRSGIILGHVCHEFEMREVSRNLINQWGDALYITAFRTFDAIFLHGEANLMKFQSMFAIPIERLHSISHGNEQIFPETDKSADIGKKLRSKYGLDDTQPVVLFFGNLTPSKGIPDLIQAFGIVHSRNPKARLVIAGMPSRYIDMNLLHKMVADLRLSEAVVFDSRYLDIEEIAPLMQLAAVAVYPYHSITQSGALQAAYTFGKPVVATKVGGFLESVEDGKSGFLVPPESPAELADAILKIINDPILAKEMGSHAKHLSETRFAWEPIARDILKVYSGLVKTKNL